MLGVSVQGRDQEGFGLDDFGIFSRRPYGVVLGIDPGEGEARQELLFFRAFRQTFGETPLAYIMERRIRRAQDLMLTSRVPLSQVALECGMCDQAHFCRVFRRIVGINPNAWRRQFLVDPADGSVAREIGRATPQRST